MLPQTPIDESVDIFSRLNIVNAISPDDNKGEVSLKFKLILILRR